MITRLWTSAWLLLALANLFWAGNIVIGRAVSADIPPLAFTTFRWFGAFLIVLPFAIPHLRQDFPALLRHKFLLIVMGACGFAAFNSMSYRGMHDTTALNALLLQSAMPLVVLLWLLLLFRERPRRLQICGVVVSMLGVAAIASRGSVAHLLHLSLNPGDIWILSSISFYALYAALLRRRPAVHPLSFLAAAFGVASVILVPLAALEYASGARIHGGTGSALAILYTMIFPSVLSTVAFNRGVELIGAGRGGQATHLMPVFGSVLAVTFLGETFHLYHLLGIALIMAGIVLASVSRPIAVPAARRPASPKAV